MHFLFHSIAHFQTDVVDEDGVLILLLHRRRRIVSLPHHDDVCDRVNDETKQLRVDRRRHNYYLPMMMTMIP